MLYLGKANINSSKELLIVLALVCTGYLDYLVCIKGGGGFSNLAK